MTNSPSFARAIKREIFGAVPETCPAVDLALQIASDEIKEQTTRMREAMYEFAERAMSAEEGLGDAERKIEELENIIDDLMAEIKELEERQNG